MSTDSTIRNLDLNVRAKIDDLSKRLNQAETKIKSFESVANSLGSSLKRVGEIALGVFSGNVLTAGVNKLSGLVSSVVGKFEGLIAEQYDTILSTESLATILGTNRNVLRAYSLAAERATLDQSALQVALVKTGRFVSMASDAQSDSAKTLKELGVTYNELKRLSPDQQFIKILEAIEKIPRQGDRIRIAMKLWEESGAQFLQATSQGFRQAEKDFQRFGLAISDDGVESVNKLHVSIVDLVARFKGFAAQFLTGFAGDISTWFDSIGKQFDKLSSRAMAQKILNVFQSIGNGIIEFINPILKWLGNVETALARINLLAVKAMIAAKELQMGTRRMQTYGDRWDTWLSKKNTDKDYQALAELYGQEQKFNADIINSQLSGKGFQLPKLNFTLPPENKQPVVAQGSNWLKTIAGKVEDRFDSMKDTIATWANATATDIKKLSLSGLDQLIKLASTKPLDKLTPQSFSAVTQGSVEAARAIFEASKAKAENEKAAAEKRHKEAVDQLKKIRQAIAKNLVFRRSGFCFGGICVGGQ